MTQQQIGGPVSSRAHAPAAERFLGSISADAALPPDVPPALAAVVVTGALFERLTAGQAHDLLRALPLDVQPLLEPSYARREGRPVRQFGRAELLDRVGEALAMPPIAAELVVSAVFQALCSALPDEEIAHVTQQLPHDLQELWRRPVPPPAEDIPSSLELLHQVLGDIERSGALPSHVPATAAFATVMCLFGRRLSGGEAKNLELGLPNTLRPLVEACLVHRREEQLTFESDELFANVSVDLRTSLEEAEAIVLAVLAAAMRVLPREELDRVASQLPSDLRALWWA